MDTISGLVTCSGTLPTLPVSPTPMPSPSPSGPSGPSGPVPTSPSSASKVPIQLPGGLTDLQIDTILSLVSIAENSSIEWWKQYGYAENIGDGRGITTGLAGFCSGTGDLLEVFQELQKINPNHYLLKYLPALIKVNGTANTSGLNGLIKDINAYGNDIQFQQAQWRIILKLYWGPAMNFANKKGLKSAFAKGQLYDTIINVGDLNFASRVKSKSPSEGGDETTWLTDFLNVKERLITVEDKSLDDGQNDRVVLWRNILKTGNLNLNRPLKGLMCYGDTFNIV